MSGDEQDLAILRLVKRRAETRKHRAALESELRAAGHSLFDIGASLRAVKVSGAAMETPRAILARVIAAPEICGLGRIQAMLEDLDATEQVLKDLNRNAAELGID